MTLRTSITPTEEARMLDGTGRWVFRVEVKRRADAGWTDVTASFGGDWVLAISTEADAPDRPVTAFTVRILRAADGYSMAPGISATAINTALGAYVPLIYAGSLIRIDAGNITTAQTRADAVWHRWLEGEIYSSEWTDDVVAQCLTLDGVIQDTQIEEEEVRGEPEPGTPLENEIQGLLDRWFGVGIVPLTVEGDPDTGVGQYKTPIGSLGDFLLSQAQRIAWDLRYRWNETASEFRYTLYLPPRDKTTPDLTLSPSQIYEVPGLKVDRTYVRNRFTLTYPDKDTGQPEKRYALDSASIDDFRAVWMGMQEPADSSINTAAKADALLAFARNDLGRPPVEKSIRIPFMPFLTLHHMVRVQADGIRFDFDQDYGVVGTSHSVTSEGAHTTVNLHAGSIVGMYYAWRRRSPAPGTGPALDVFAYTEPGTTDYTISWYGDGVLVSIDGGAFEEPPPSPFTVARGTTDKVYVFRASKDGQTRQTAILVPATGSDQNVGLINFREYADDAGSMVLAWDGLGSLVTEVWAGDVLFNVPLPDDPWALVRGVTLPLPPGTLSRTYAKPGEGQRRLIQVEARLSDGSDGLVYRLGQFGTPAPIDWRAEPVEAGGNITLTVRLNDGRGVISTVRFYTLVLGVRSGPLSATASGTNWYAFSLALDPKHPVGIQPELLRSDGLPPILGEMYTADLDKEANIIDVRRTLRSSTGLDTIYVDGDTDTVSLWYKEDVAGVLGAETAIAARGSDPRFGSFTSQGGGTERKYRIYGKNAAAEVGPYVDWRVETYTAPVILPAVEAVYYAVVNRPNSGGPGQWDVHDVSWDISSAVNDATHGISVTFYTSDVKVITQTATPSSGTLVYATPVGGSTVRQHTAKVMVYELTGGGTVSMMESAPVSTTIDTTPYP